MANTTLTTRRKIETFVFDAVMGESHSAPVDITSHAVEQGVEITDHAILKQHSLVISGVVSATACGIRNTTRKQSAYYDLMRIRDEREPVTVITGLKVYNNMLISDVRADDKKGYTSYTVDLKSVRFAETAYVDVPNTHIGSTSNSFRSKIYDRAIDAKTPAQNQTEETTANRTQGVLYRGAVSGKDADETTIDAIKKQSILKSILGGDS